MDVPAKGCTTRAFTAPAPPNEQIVMARLHPAASKSSRGRTAPRSASLHRKDSVTKTDAPPRTLKALNTLNAASKPLVPGATRAVLGEGPIGAAVAFVGEQPGDQEDRQGRPFVGPAGQLLDGFFGSIFIFPGPERGEKFNGSQERRQGASDCVLAFGKRFERPRRRARAAEAPRDVGAMTSSPR